MEKLSILILVHSIKRVSIQIIPRCYKQDELVRIYSLFKCGHLSTNIKLTLYKALLASVANTPLGKVRPCDIPKLVHLLKSRKARGLVGIRNKRLGHLPRRHWYI
jgi:hypothetical protein